MLLAKEIFPRAIKLNSRDYLELLISTGLDVVSRIGN